jgi:hypothetical protein
MQNMTLKLNGRINKESFKGEMTLILGSSTESHSVDVLFTEDGIGYISDNKITDSGKGLLGLLILDRKSNTCCVLIYEDSDWSSANGLVFSAPATTRAEAVDILEKLSQSTEWLATVEWD